MLWTALLVLAATTAVAGQSARAPVALIAPREFLQLFDIGPQQLATFSDGQPLDAVQRERMLAILYRLRQYPPAALDHYSQSPDALAALSMHADKSRGELFTVAGRVTRVVRDPLEAAARERFGCDAVYRCTIETAAGQGAVVYTLDVPAQWPLDEPFDQRAGAQAMFLQQLPAPDGDTPAVHAAPWFFVARRVAWYPDNTLGKLGMDFGLFDEVRDRTRLDERECFYQMLAAVRRADPQALKREAGENLARQIDEWRRQANDPALDRAARAAARRGLAQAERGSDDVVGLFNEPQAQRGKLFTLRGEALRAIEVRVDDPDIVSRFGIHRYYEVEIVTDDSQNNPIVCCVAQLPEGMPLGDDIREGVRVRGFFLKSWSYDVGRDRSDPARQQLAPLLVGRSLEWIPAPAPRGQSAAVAAALVAALLAAAGLLWYVRRGDRRALAAAQRARVHLPETISLDVPTGGDERGGADQRGGAE